ncbi:MAG TPA: enoyl-CoA hydratase/isomerase family protein [Candidatus Poseidoniaceae archaeon]|nr:MAG TPA: enoyl-CoA hydratase/isomerase family protein [Candidatus Poseidoniales archaeon]HII44950.1 enoyl-CoA hydratase/isomerase family protein [Candidatus Poseidoniaceae archaeon]|tara:strand:- start:796 stop:1638 length:843 start_codon:yes stop_codon:yes gene_type:complete
MDEPNTSVLEIEKIPVSGSSISGYVAIATINRPNKLNALNAEVMESLKALCTWVESNAEIRCLVITGAEPLPAEEGKRAKPNAFVAGADISEFVGMDSKATKVKFTDNAVEKIWSMAKPTIAMIDGFALGGGCEVACSCDIRIASERSKFGTPEINLGLIPGYGATQRLAKLVGYGKALEMIMTGEMITADEARNIGLVNHVCEHENLREFTINIADKIASKSGYTVTTAKRVVKAALNSTLDEGIAIEAEEFAKLFDSHDQEEGVRAFMQRDKPKWLDR